MRTCTLVNLSTVVSATEAAAGLAGVQYQIQTDFFAAHGVWCNYNLSTSDVATERIYLLDDTTQANALGFHTLVGGIPVGCIFAKTDMDYGVAWTTTLSHEACEQALNPSCINGVLTVFNGRLIFANYESSDPVENDTYTINGVSVSNFVFPAWFGYQDPVGGRYDQMGALKAPLTISPGGYFGYGLINGNAVTWNQSEGAELTQEQANANPYARRTRARNHRLSLHAACKKAGAA